MDGTESRSSGRSPSINDRSVMPREKLRRFDPRFGVSESMLEAEGIYVGQEFRDYRRLSTEITRELLGRHRSIGLICLL
jgi:hypothetical protein